MPSPATRNPWICVLIVANLGFAGIICIGGIVYLAAAGKTCPESLIALGSGALGALSSFLVQVPRGQAGAGAGHEE